MSGGRRQRGLSLVELMLAMAVGLVLTAGVVGVFASSRATYQLQDDLSRLQESARFTFELLSRDLREAGFVGCNYDWTRLNFNAAPIAQAISGIDGATLTGGDATTPDRIAILVTGGAGTPNAIVAEGGGVQMTVDLDDDPFQAGDFALLTNCKWANVFQVATATQNQNPQPITSTAAGAPASLLRYSTPGNPPPRAFKTPLVVYRIRQGPQGRPELNRIEVRVAGAFAANGTWPGCAAPNVCEQVAEGVENLQILYGVFDPAARTTSYLTADQVNFAPRAPETLVAVRVALLLAGVNTVARGLNAPTTFDLLGTEVNVADDGRLRRVFTTTITLRNRL